MVTVSPAEPDWLEALAEGDDVFTARFGIPTVDGWVGFPEALRVVVEGARERPLDPWGTHLFFDDEGALVGWGGFKGAPDDGEVEVGYAVAPARQGRGIATAVVGRLIDRARTAGVRVVCAHTLAEENPSTSVRRKNGFVRTAQPASSEGDVWRWELHLPEEEVPVTFRSGPSDPLRLGDEPGTWVEVLIDAPSPVVWALITDINLPARFSEEFLGAAWVSDGPPAVGAVFNGRNRHEALGEWETPAFVEVLDEGRSFGWATVDASNPGSRWRYDLTPQDGRTRLRYSVSIGPGPSGLSIAIEAMPDKEPRIIMRRLKEHHANMHRTVLGIRGLAEGGYGR